MNKTIEEYKYNPLRYKKINVTCSICENIFTIMGGRFDLQRRKAAGFSKKIGVVVSPLLYCSKICVKSDKAKKIRHEHNILAMRAKYGVDNIFQLDRVKEIIQQHRKKVGEDEIMNKKRRTLLERYGVDNCAKIKEVRIKQKITCLKKYGATTPMNSPEIRAKITHDNLNKYGVEHYVQTAEWSKKFKETIKEKYGDEKYFYFGSNYYRSLIKEKYGVDNVMQIPEIADKCFNSSLFTRYNYHKYVLPSGQIIAIQGFENRTFDKLFSLGYTESEIKFKKTDMPQIYYNFNGRRYRYFCDFYIKKDNLVVETKSYYILHCDYERNKLKFEAVKHAGFDFVLDVYDV